MKVQIKKRLSGKNRIFMPMKKLLHIIGLILLFATNTTAANADFFCVRVEDVVKAGKTFSNLPRNGLINPKEIRFSQNSISSTFRDGTTLDGLITGLKNKTINPKDIPPIRILKRMD